MTTRDKGVWREHRATWPRREVDHPAALLYAIHSAIDSLASGCREQHLAADWLRATVTVRPAGTGISVTVGTWCHPDGRREEYAIQAYSEPMRPDMPAERMEFAVSVPVEPGDWVRDVGPWREVQ